MDWQNDFVGPFPDPERRCAASSFRSDNSFLQTRLLCASHVRGLVAASEK